MYLWHCVTLGQCDYDGISVFGSGIKEVWRRQQWTRINLSHQVFIWFKIACKQLSYIDFVDERAMIYLKMLRRFNMWTCVLICFVLMLVFLLCSYTRAVHEHGLDRRSVPAHRHAQHPAHVLPAVRREGRARTPVAAGWYQDRHLSQQVGFRTDTCRSRSVSRQTPVAAGWW